MESNELKEIVSQFDIKGTVSEVKPLGDGLINDTFKVVTAEADTPLCRQALEAKGVQVTVCEKNGAKALRALLEEHPQAALLDAFIAR